MSSFMLFKNTSVKKKINGPKINSLNWLKELVSLEVKYTSGYGIKEIF